VGNEMVEDVPLPQDINHHIDPQPQPPGAHPPGEGEGMPPLLPEDEEPLANTEKSFSSDVPPQFGHTAFSLLFFSNISKLLSHFSHLYSYNGIIFSPVLKLTLANNRNNVKVLHVASY
jgi:hypothetical protein